MKEMMTMLHIAHMKIAEKQLANVGENVPILPVIVIVRFVAYSNI